MYNSGGSYPVVLSYLEHIPIPGVQRWFQLCQQLVLVETDPQPSKSVIFSFWVPVCLFWCFCRVISCLLMALGCEKKKLNVKLFCRRLPTVRNKPSSSLVSDIHCCYFPHMDISKFIQKECGICQLKSIDTHAFLILIIQNSPHILGLYAAKPCS